MKRSTLLSIASAVAVLLLVATVTFTLSNRRSQASALSTPQSASEHTLSMPYYSVKGGWESVLTLNNAAEDPLNVSVKVYSLDGTPLSLPEQVLNPLQNVSLRLSELLAQADPSGKFKEGSLELRFRHGSDMALGPQLTVTNAGKGWSFDTEPAMGQKSSRLEGLWWSLDQETGARVALSNTLDRPLTVRLNVDAQGRQTPYPLAQLNAHQTVVLNVQDVLKDAGLRAEAIGQGGLSVEYDGPAGALIAHGFVFSNKRRFASNLHFVDPAGQPTSLLDATGMPLGRPADAAAFAPGAFFTPTLFLRNTTSEPQTATVSAQYTAAGQPKTEALPVVNLKPHEVRAVSFSALANSLRGTAVEDAGVRVESGGAPGAVIGQLVSLGERGACVDVPLLSVMLKGARSGAHPFNLDGNTRSVLHLKNLGDKATRAIVKILYEGGGDYTLDLVKIQPGQSLAIDVQALKEANKPDIHGHLFPADLTSGQVTWSQHGEPVILGRLTRSGPSGAGAPNFSCGGLCSCGAVYDYAVATPEYIEGESGDYRGPVGIQEYDYYEACPWRGNNHEGPFTVDAQFEPGDITVADVDIYGSTVILNDAGSSHITARWVTVVHNTLGGDCAEGNCETDCQPQESLVGLSIPVTVKPRITGLSPERGPVGTSLTVTISGRGLRSGATVSAGSGITTSVTNASSGSLEVTFTIDANATPGNHAVTVTVRGQQSNSLNFFVQVPTSLRLLSQAVSGAYGSGILPNGCPASARPGLAGGTAGPFGFIARLSYQVMDQQNPAQPIQATMPLRESLVNFMADGAPAGGDNINTLVTASGTTESDGTFVDDPVGGCNDQSFGLATFTQHLYMSTDLTLHVRTNGWRLTGRNGCGSITNSNDVSVSVPCQ